MSLILDWAESVKTDLIHLQTDTRIPALWAITQFCHESAGKGPRGLSGLAEHADNYAGLKYRKWQAKYGCSPIVMDTWEEIGGERVDTTDAFCKCPSWQVWLEVYADLLTDDPYDTALAYADEPLLYGSLIAQKWATDSRYMIGVSKWMRALYPLYKDTLRLYKSEPVPVAVEVFGESLEGYRNENGKTAGPVRPWLDIMASAGVAGWVYQDEKLIVYEPAQR